MVDVMLRNKPIDMLTREEAVDALKQALARVAELEGLPLSFGPYPLVLDRSVPPGVLIAKRHGEEIGRIISA